MRLLVLKNIPYDSKNSITPRRWDWKFTSAPLNGLFVATQLQALVKGSVAQGDQVQFGELEKPTPLNTFTSCFTKLCKNRS